MKKTIITLFIAGLAAVGFSINANAQEFHIKKLVCIETEGLLTPDAIYIRYQVDGGSVKRYPGSSDLSFVAGAERSNYLFLNTRKGATIHIELWDHDTFDPDDYIGSFDVNVDEAREKTVYLKQQDGTAYYALTYVIEWFSVR